MVDLRYNAFMSRKVESKLNTGEVSHGNTKNLEAQVKIKGSKSCGNAEQRTKGGFVGEVKSTRIVPRGISRWFEVVISDGTGKINGWFFGRNSIAGMNLGSIVYFEGLVQLDEGEMTIANPYYEIL